MRAIAVTVDLHDPSNAGSATLAIDARRRAAGARLAAAGRRHHHPPMSDAARRILLAILILGIAGISVELWLLAHTEDFYQLIPLWLAGVGGRGGHRWWRCGRRPARSASSRP